MLTVVSTNDFPIDLWVDRVLGPEVRRYEHLAHNIDPTILFHRNLNIQNRLLKNKVP